MYGGRSTVARVQQKDELRITPLDVPTFSTRMTMSMDKMRQTLLGTEKPHTRVEGC